MAAAAGNDRRQPPHLFTIITLNTNRRTDLAGLPAILRENRPDFVFLQEVNVTQDGLKAAVGGLGYSIYMSTYDNPKRTIAVLSLHSTITVSNIKPGFLQKLIFENLVFFHIHAPSTASVQDKNIFFQQIANVINESPNLLSILIGDFNCVIEAKDVENQNIHNHMNTVLRNLVITNSLSDAYRVLHPTQVRFSWYRRSFPAVRLDKVYLPPLLEARPRVARYFPTTSDHHAFILKMDMSGLLAQPAGRSAVGLYWKFNSSLLKEKDFMPAFADMWRLVVAAAANYPAGAGVWWETVAKPAIVDFCRRFARLAAIHR